jgi:hypothetical protein
MVSARQCRWGKRVQLEHGGHAIDSDGGPAYSCRADDMNRRFEDTRALLRAEFFRVEQVTDARLKHLEEDR